MQQTKWKPLHSPWVRRDEWRVFTAVLERCGDVLRTVRLRRPAIVLGVLVAGCHFGFALDPALDINQYAHTSWKLSEGVATGTTHTIVQTKDGYLWLATEIGRASCRERV